MTSLADLSDPDEQPLSDTEIQTYLDRLDSPHWSVTDEGHLQGRFSFDDFAGALEFVTEVGALAEDMWHHPEITLRWGEVIIEVWSHEADALQELDFVFAARASHKFEQ